MTQTVHPSFFFVEKLPVLREIITPENSTFFANRMCFCSLPISKKCPQHTVKSIQHGKKKFHRRPLRPHPRSSVGLNPQQKKNSRRKPHPRPQKKKKRHFCAFALTFEAILPEHSTGLQAHMRRCHIRSTLCR